jgi:2-phosphosulfolactate phosphatase
VPDTTDIMPGFAHRTGVTIHDVVVLHAVGVDGARSARGVVVVIDVLRAFTLSAYAFAGGARDCLLVRTVDEARELAAKMPGAVLSAEVDTLPVPGIGISNSPTAIQNTDVRGRSVIQRTSAGTQVINAVPDGHPIYAASLVVARATAQACLLRSPDSVTLVASADHPEDHACASYIEAMLRGVAPSLDQLLQPLLGSARYRELAAGGWPGFPASDLELALVADRFDFAMPATRSEPYFRLTPQSPNKTEGA